MPSIRNFLDISLDHLPKDMQDDLNTHDGVTAYRQVFDGWLIWVPPDPILHAEGYEDFPIAVLNIQLCARQLGCDYVLLDPDASFDEDLAVRLDRGSLTDPGRR